jgi:hypothetical protein
VDWMDMKDGRKKMLHHPLLFCEFGGGIRLRKYQQQAARAIIDSVIKEKGYSFVVMFPRQSGKNELQAQIEAYLMTLLSDFDTEIVKVSPTWKPQSLNAMRRLERTLERNLLTENLWVKEQGYIYRLGSARIFFFSGQPEANIVGATASTLLEVDEAQDVQTAKFDKDIAPMAASTNATRVFWGTAWTSRTLLSRELQAAREAEHKDGIRRTFVLTAEDIAEEVPAYGIFVDQQVQKLGRTNPMVRTQYFSEEIDADGGMFPPARIASMQGTHPPLTAPRHGQTYAILLDIAGEDEGAADGEPDSLRNPGRDSTALTIIQIDHSTRADPILQASTYRAVHRCLWTGRSHTNLYAVIRSIIDTWKPSFTVVDATGVGEGLYAFLEKAYPARVIPYKFSSKSKSDLGWKFLTICDTGRWKEHTALTPAGVDFEDASRGSELNPPWVSNMDLLLSASRELQKTFFNQLSFMAYEIKAGPNKLMRWSVPDGTRDPATSDLVHDDLVISAALCAVLEDHNFAPTAPAFIIPASDPLEDLDHGF